MQRPSWSGQVSECVSVCVGGVEGGGGVRDKWSQIA